MSRPDPLRPIVRPLAARAFASPCGMAVGLLGGTPTLAVADVAMVELAANGLQLTPITTVAYGPRTVALFAIGEPRRGGEA